ncbi:MULTISPECIES: ABC transporter permease [Streptomyces]|uniref:Transport permease protein n=1 Tax=Streptomyces misionensis TaxID=67331 RepID=A0A1H4WP14_9ACTN|nr:MULTISPECIES: ABC transporter permease [Streptomyces]SEC95083.1 teichoic acid transport system permease protein [Streptomyces misionensis]SFY50246.1 Teichoic acid translocation permease protein TagG [Streptomyces sp. F-1]
MSQVLDTPPPTQAPADDLRALAARHGLTVSGARPSLPEYIRQLWARRHFITAFATAKLTAQYSQAKLGQVWQVMTPLLNAAVYYFIFGVLLGTKRGVPDYIPFLVTGVFVWTFTQSSIQVGTRAISGNLGLVRALHFPRAALPISFCLQQLQQLLFSMAALVVILLCFGVPVSASWLLVIPALVLQFTFNAGMAMIMARMGAKTPDIAQLMPFILRTWMYVSGVMWSIDKLTAKDHLPHLVTVALETNPAAVYIDLMRFALIDSFHAKQLPPHVWAAATGWALLAGIGGFIYFWKAEETYGRG